ncbi:alpha/beta hydrolase [Bacillus sp. B4EP4a]|uniref:alpha/beta hydrolase n=1 Tax=Bacillus sp. B4EP4a TaxID=2590665 RepID=UPI00336A03FA
MQQVANEYIEQTIEWEESILKVNQRKINGNEKEITYTHIENGSPAVCFMFSGAGYTYEKPLFYYSTMMMLQNQFDVVHIHYAYDQDIFKHPLVDITKVIVNDISPVITEVLQNQEYQGTVFLGKSLGTIPIINGMMKNERFMNAKMILLTPLLKFDSIFEGLCSNHSAHIVIGEKDHHYIPGKIERIENKSNISMDKIPHANHSLDIEPLNTSRSITMLEGVMNRMEEFLKK